MDPYGASFRLEKSDGSTVFFEGGGGDWRVMQINDPHGLRTFFFYNTDGTLNKVVGPVPSNVSFSRAAPSGYRAVKFSYATYGSQPGITVVDRIGIYEADSQSTAIQTAKYNYSYLTRSVSAPEGPVTTVSGWVLSSVTYEDEVQTDRRTATYDYQAVRCIDCLSLFEGEAGQGLNLAFADDPRVNGNMTQARYVLRGGPGGAAVATQCPTGTPLPASGTDKGDYHRPNPNAINQELSASGWVMSNFYMPCDGTSLVGQRWETNGLGFERKLYFGKSAGVEPGAYFTPGTNGTGYWTPPEVGQAYVWGYLLGKLTDYYLPGVDTPTFTYQSNGWMEPWRIIDQNGNLTQLQWTLYRKLSKIWKRVTPESYVEIDYFNPGSSLGYDVSSIDGLPVMANQREVHKFSQRDEYGNYTYYVRDAKRRIMRIDYPGGASESMTYNDFNQVTAHAHPPQATGVAATENRVYDATGLLTRVWNSADGAQGPNETIFTYYTTGPNRGRVWKVQDPRARVAGKEFSAQMEYNLRGQVTKVIYPSTSGGTDPSVSYEYDKYGNCTKITDELGGQRLFAYDEYRRCTSYTETVNAPNGNGSGTVASRTWYWSYDRFYLRDGNWVGYGPDTHTNPQWRVAYAPSNRADGGLRVTVRYFDANERITREESGFVLVGSTWTGQVMLGGTWVTTDSFTVQASYDAHGNKLSSTDPLGRVTTYDYDSRHRQWRVNEPAGTAGGPLRVTTTEFDLKDRKTKVTFPDGRFQRWADYDTFDQARQWFDERNTGSTPTATMTYQWGPMKKLASVSTWRELDGGGVETQLTTFTYDGLGRETRRLFPDGSDEVSTYEFGALKTWKARKGAVKTIDLYDARGRETHHSWSDGTEGAAGVTRVWDAAGRLTSIANGISGIGYTYDEADQVLSETTTVLGAGGSATVTYRRYPDGTAGQVIYPDGTIVRRDFNGRGQLEKTGTVNAGGSWLYQAVSYGYLADGKPSYSDYPNGRGSNWSYDAAGRLSATNTYSSTTSYAYRTYKRDQRDRIQRIQKVISSNPSEDGKFDVFAYDEEGQLTGAWYEASDNVGNGYARKDEFIYDKMGNRMGANWLAHVGAAWTFLRRDNGLNQIGTWGPMLGAYDDMPPFLPDPPAPPPPGNGVQRGDGAWAANFDALNRPFVSWTPASGYLWLGYDPLGRCVKRWQGGDGNPALNPATYLYYDGWNLIQEGSGAGAAQKTQIYLHGARVDEIVARYHVPTGRWYTHHYDGRTHCVLVLYGDGPESGAVAEQYAYDAFGRAMVFNAAGVLQNPNGALAQSAIGNRFLFTGREWLVEWGVYDYRHRHYHPLEGRFLQPDPIHFSGGDHNLYRYCHNDPVNHVDPDGLKLRDWLKNTAKKYQPQAEQAFKEQARRSAMRAQLAAAGQRALLQAKANKAAGRAPRDNGDGTYLAFINRNKAPEASKHLEDAGATGKQLTLDRAGRDDRRANNMQGEKTHPGKDRDEAPPAVFLESSNASVRLIASGDNRSAGGQLGVAVRGLPDGAKVTIHILD
ncbi:MAG: hypothetical protein JSR82_21060 [Verrucomicrobia bacterium]|nr:hypothetical protein [Verrucomicrobiota bacterium]